MKAESIYWKGGKYYDGEGCQIPLDRKNIVFVGKNNSGKSRVLEHLIDIRQKTDHPIFYSVKYDGKILKSLLESANLETHYEAGPPFLEYLVNANVEYRIETSDRDESPLLSTVLEFHEQLTIQSEPVKNLVTSFHANQWIPFKNHCIFFIGSERNIFPEVRYPKQEMDHIGKGITSAIAVTMHRDGENRKLVTEKVLNFVNYVLGDNEQILEITPIIITDNPDIYEIFLRTELKDLVPISKSGSSLKSLIMISFQLYRLISEFQHRSEKCLVIEEPENNIHAFALRRLLDRLTEECASNNINLILTTHSNVTIDFFANRKDTTIINVENDGKNINAKPIEHLDEIVEVIQALGCKASDLLQANGVIWVEGPSDRVYIKKWIDIYTDKKWVEGRHYQIAFYGGALIKHHDADNVPEDDTLINLLSINQNAFFICDSDLEGPNDNLKKPVVRITEKLEKSVRHGFWITFGREIESYIPIAVLQQQRKLTEPLLPIDKFQNFAHSDKPGEQSYWEKISGNSTFDKVIYAAKFAKLMTIDNMSKQDDWSDRMKSLVNTIAAWNEESPPRKQVVVAD